jgi:hypothetical protein
MWHLSFGSDVSANFLKKSAGNAHNLSADSNDALTAFGPEPAVQTMSNRNDRSRARLTEEQKSRRRSMRIILAAIMIVAGSMSAVAQSSTATSGTTKPLTTAPSSSTMPNGQPKYQPPPAARSGGQLRIDNDANNSGWIDLKRNK